MTNTIETIRYKGYTIRIESDDDPPDPREYNDFNVGTLLCWHRRANLGDDKFPTDAFESWCYEKDRAPEVESMPDFIREEYGARVVLPVYLYEHSGMHMSTSPFSCSWDSGQVGWIFDTPKGIRSVFGEVEMLDEHLTSCLKQEVETYAHYIGGDYCGYIIETAAGQVESCWGYETAASAEEAAKEYIDSCLKDAKPDLSVVTDNGETFTEAQSRELARLIFLRFGRDQKAAHRAWCRLLYNNCALEQYMQLVEQEG